MEKVVITISLFQSSVAIVQKPSHRFAPYISGLVSISLQHQPKWQSECLVKVNINLQIHVLVFISNSIFHFRLSCLDKNYDLCLKVSKKLLSIIFKFSMISVQYLPLRAIFYQFYDVICRHCESIVVLVSSIQSKIHKNLAKISRKLKFSTDVPYTFRVHQKKSPSMAPWERPKSIMVYLGQNSLKNLFYK